MKKKIWLSSPHMGGNEQKYIDQAFLDNWIAPLGPHVDQLESNLVNYLGKGHCVALSSGTASLHLALILAGVKKGDEVLASSLTFSASINPVLYVGAIPVFIDSEIHTWNMDPDILEEAIKDRIRMNKKPAAVICVDLYGMPAKMDGILNLCREYEIPVIEDAAEALGSSYKNEKSGTFGDYGILSFNGNKIITTSGGGALVCPDNEKASKARYLATQSRDPAPHYQHSEIGYNYRMSNILAGIGLGQLEVLDLRVAQRRENNTFYRNLFAGQEGISFLSEPDHNFYSNYWLTTIIINPKIQRGIDREGIRKALEEENIEARPIWKPMHMQPVFKKFQCYNNKVAERVFRDGLCLPSGSNLTLEDKERISEVILKTLK